MLCLRAMRSCRCMIPTLVLIFLIAGRMQAQTPATNAVLNQTVASAQAVAYCDLLGHTEDFNNKMIRVRAIYEIDFEKSVITSPSCLTPLPMTWITFDGDWESRTTRSVRKKVSKLKWGVPLDIVFVGKFMTDGRYGHMDMYPLSVEVYKAETATTPKNAGKVPKS
jgi:hypothetical protein